MNKLPLSAFLALFMLTTSNKLIACENPKNQPSTWQMIITLIWGEQKPQNNPDQAPAGVTVEDYLTQFRYDLNGTANPNRIPLIPWKEIAEMEAAIKEELLSSNLRDTEKANNVIRSVLVNHVKTQTKLDLQQLEKEGYYIAPEDYQSIPNSHEYDLIARLGRAPHLNGECIAQYFGEYRKHATKNAYFNRHKNNHFGS